MPISVTLSGDRDCRIGQCEFGAPIPSVDARKSQKIVRYGLPSFAIAQAMSLERSEAMNGPVQAMSNGANLECAAPL
jgi:hypothetical protein